MITNHQSNLRHILNANAMFSATNGLIFVLAASALAQFLSTTPAIMYILGVGLFGYATLLTYNASRPAISRGFTLFAIIGEITWVLLSILLLIVPGFDFTPAAKWAIGITAVCVDIFATLQFLEWRKMK